jgi:hypothetical protein
MVPPFIMPPKDQPLGREGRMLLRAVPDHVVSN